MMVPNVDAYAPHEIARKIEALGVTKARSDTLSLLVLAVLAGAFCPGSPLFYRSGDPLPARIRLQPAGGRPRL